MREEKIKDGTGVHSKTTSKQDETSAFSPAVRAQTHRSLGLGDGFLPVPPAIACRLHDSFHFYTSPSHRKREHYTG